MSKLQKPSSVAFIDYVPAQLHENQDWRIVYSVKNPYTNVLERKRTRVKPLKSLTERRKLAKRMVLEINNRLASGWNPFYEQKGAKEFTKLYDALNVFIRRTEIEYQDGNFRLDTFKTYNSQIKMLKEYLELIEKENLMCFQFDESLISNYLDYVRYDKGRSARTRDNYLMFIGTLSRFLLSKKYITFNPTEHFTKINKKEKKRIIINDVDKKKIFDFWTRENPNYLLVCLCCYFCLIRRTELTKIRVQDFNPIKNTIWIDASDSKSRIGKHISVPRELNILLMQHVKKAKQTDYLFSVDNFKPGKEQCYPNKITKFWSRMRTKIKISKNIDWYSLKDTGITDLLKAGVPLISVRDQARHSTSKQTDAYTPTYLKNADASILNAKIKFN